MFSRRIDIDFKIIKNNDPTTGFRFTIIDENGNDHGCETWDEVIKTIDMEWKKKNSESDTNKELEELQ